MNKLLTRTTLFSLAIMMTPLATTAGEWGIGTAIATHQPPQSGVKRETLGAPYISYQGERLRIDLGDISYSLYDTEKFEIAIQGEFRFDGYKPGDSTALAGMASRHPSFDAGLSLSHKAEWGALKLVVLSDVTGTHEGLEARGSYERPFAINRWLLVPAIGISWQNESLVDYYYGVRAHEANANRPAYAGYDATNVFAEITGGYSFSNKIEWLAGIKHTRFDSSISDSPIVEKRTQTTIVTSLLYKF